MYYKIHFHTIIQKEVWKKLNRFESPGTQMTELGTNKSNITPQSAENMNYWAQNHLAPKPDLFAKSKSLLALTTSVLEMVLK